MSGYALDTVDPSVRLIPARGVFDIFNQVMLATSCGLGFRIGFLHVVVLCVKGMISDYLA